MDQSVPAGAAKLLDFIGSIEAPAGYESVYGNKQKKLAKPLTQMTIGQIVTAKPTFTKRFGSSACGRYQFMRDTLRSLVEEAAATMNDVLTPDLQDRLGYVLLKRRGYASFMKGKISRPEFGKRLAQEWASFPVLSATKGDNRRVDRGETFYAGDKLNKALVKPERVEALLDVIRPREEIAPAPDPVPMPRPRPEGVVAPPLAEVELEEEELPEVVETTAPPLAVAHKIQRLLKEKGFHDIGIVPSDWGPRSKDNFATWKASWNRRHPEDPVELGDVITSEIVDKLEGDEHRPVSIERATADADDLPDNTGVLNRLWNRILVGLGITGVGTKVVSTEGEGGTSVLDAVEHATSGWVRIQGIAESIGGFVAHNWLIFLVGAVVIGWWVKEKWKAKKVEKFRTGELVA